MAWCVACEDPVSGADQKSDTLWASVVQRFGHLHPNSTRTREAMKSRWQDINREVGVFVGCMAARNESGKTEQDRIEDAKAMYSVKRGKSFAFIRPYEYLSTKPCGWPRTTQLPNEHVTPLILMQLLPATPSSSAQ